MKEELPNEKLREAEDMEIDIKELLFKCLIHWPWFVGTVVACLIAAYVYLLSLIHISEPTRPY